MLGPIIRFLKRFAVLIPGLIIAYFVAADLYPFLDRGAPSSIAFLLTYVIAAYLLIPAALRIIRIFLPPSHIPLYCITPDGFASDPINIAFEGTEKQVITAMTKAGWYKADPRTVKTIFRMITSFLFRQEYPNAPFSSLFLLGRRQDMGFQLPISDTPHHRHHVRFWASTPKLSEEVEAHLKFWQKHMPGFKAQKKQLWLGAASKDVGLAFIRHNAQISHMIHPDTNAERDLITEHVKATGMVKRTKKVTIGTPYALRNRVFRGQLKTDGKMTILTLK